MVAHAPLKVGDDETGNIEWALYLDCHDVGRAPPPCKSRVAATNIQCARISKLLSDRHFTYAVVSVEMAVVFMDMACNLGYPQPSLHFPNSTPSSYPNTPRRDASVTTLAKQVTRLPRWAKQTDSHNQYRLH
jgi:hypothetical protein